MQTGVSNELYVIQIKYLKFVCFFLRRSTHISAQEHRMVQISSTTPVKNIMDEFYGRKSFLSLSKTFFALNFTFPSIWGYFQDF